VGRIRRLGDDPEALFGMMDQGHVLVGHRGDGPVFAEEIQGVISVEAALEIQGQVQVEQRHGRHGAMVVAFLLEGELPRRVGRQLRSATDVVFVVPGDLGAEQGVGGRVVGDVFVGQQGDQPIL